MPATSPRSEAGFEGRPDARECRRSRRVSAGRHKFSLVAPLSMCGAGVASAFWGLQHPMGNSITVMNAKGGVGKTTLVLAMAETISVHHDLKVLVIDSDAHASLSTMLLPGS